MVTIKNMSVYIFCIREKFLITFLLQQYFCTHFTNTNALATSKKTPQRVVPIKKKLHQRQQRWQLQFKTPPTRW